MTTAKLPQEVRDLVAVCKSHLAFMDAVMKEASTYERGHRIAAACNRLDLAVQRIECFGIKERKQRSKP
jgi:hypothetical protein